MTIKMSDLPVELVTEILTRTPLTSIRTVRSTCQTWNTLSKNQVLGRKPFVGVVLIDNKLCSLSFDLQGIRNDSNLVGPVIKQVSVLDQVLVFDVFHCDGLLLCEVIRDNCELVVWNPYLGETRCIKPRNNYETEDMYVLGYDHNHNHKILRILDKFDYKKYDLFWLEIFEFSSNSWRVLTDVTRDWDIALYPKSTSLKGNTYFVTREQIPDDAETEKIVPFLLCFDFTSERFGPPLPLPFPFYPSALSSVSDEQLVVLYQCYETTTVDIIDIWITTKIEPNAVLWSRYLMVDITPLNGFPDGFEAGRFFIEDEKNVAVVFGKRGFATDPVTPTVHIVGQNEYLKSISMEEALQPLKEDWDLAFSSYVPSLAQLQIN